MIMIFKTIILNKKNIRYFLAFCLLLITLLSVIKIKEEISAKVYYEKNKEEYRTIIVNLKDISSLETIKKLEIISINEEENGYKIIFKTRSDVKTFISKYSNLYTDILFNDYNASNVLETLNTILIVTIWIFSIIMIILLIINLLELVLSQSKEISFYKMIGFKNKKIKNYLLLFFIIIYTLLYIVGITLSFLFNIVLEKIIYKYSLNLHNLNLELIFIPYLVIIIFIIIIVNLLYLKIKKITPIKFAINN